MKTPEAVPGRAHFVTQTEPMYLEEINDRPVEHDAVCQTDAALDRLQPPMFVPIPAGVEVATQIEDGELFDFDREVEPILEALVGAATELAMTELAREAELQSLKAAQDAFTAKRDAELAEVARLEVEVRRRQEERVRRIQQEKARKAAEEVVQRKVAAAAFARTFTASLRRTVMAQLAEAGHFYDPVRREVEAEVLPGLFAAVEGATALRQDVAALLVDEVLTRALHRASALAQPPAAEIVTVDAAAAAVAAVKGEAIEIAAAAVAAIPTEGATVANDQIQQTVEQASSETEESAPDLAGADADAAAATGSSADGSRLATADGGEEAEEEGSAAAAEAESKQAE